eukprot:scaffold967_cov148-Skeletonema_menzelii.AAC.8
MGQSCSTNHLRKSTVAIRSVSSKRCFRLPYRWLGTLKMLLLVTSGRYEEDKKRSNEQASMYGR